jgi:competence protein ComEC
MQQLTRQYTCSFNVLPIPSNTQRYPWKGDFLSNDAKDLIREAGIFHIITISGVQMTLVAGIFFFVARRLMARSPTLALNYPIKNWMGA